MNQAWILVAASLCSPLSSAAALGEMRIDFESFEAGKPPAGFITARSGGGEPAKWIVREESSAPSGRKVLVQVSADATKYRFPLCIYADLSSADATLSVMFKAISGSADQAAGIVWRYQTPDDYYVARANALEGNVVLYKMEHGKRSDLKPVGGGFFSYGSEAKIAAGRWHKLEVTVRGNRFAVSIDGKHVFDVEDDTFTGPGKVGLWTKADSVTAFDDLHIDVAKR